MNPVIWLILGGLLVVGAVILNRRAQAGRHFTQLGLGFPRIQRAAFEQPGDDDPTDTAEIGAHQYFQTALGFRLVYSCDRTNTGGMLHHLSGQMPGADEKQLTHAMLLIFSMLLEQFKSAGVETSGRFQVEQSQLGTQHLEFELTAAEHEALRQVNLTSGGKPILIGADTRPSAEQFRNAP
jgi:hypothetical protein